MIGHPSIKKLSLYVDDRLSQKRLHQIEAHLTGCKACGDKVAVLHAASQSLALPKDRLSAIQNNVMGRISEKALHTKNPIIGEFENVDGCVLIRDDSGGEPTEAFPGCAVRLGDRIYPEPDAKALIVWDQGGLLHVTKPIVASERYASHSPSPERKPIMKNENKLGLRLALAGVVVAAIVALIVIPPLMKNNDKNKKQTAQNDSQSDPIYQPTVSPSPTEAISFMGTPGFNQEGMQPDEPDIEYKIVPDDTDVKTSPPSPTSSTTTDDTALANADNNSRAVVKFVFPPPTFQGTPKDIRTDNLEKTMKVVPTAIMAPAGTHNLALNKDVTASDEMPILGELYMITDGDKMGQDGSYVEFGPGTQWIQIDLEQPSEIYAILFWHFHLEGRAYNDVVVRVADDPDFITNARTLYNSDHDNSSGLGVGRDKDYIETSKGRLIELKDPETARYVRLYSNGNTTNELNHYTEVEVYGRPISDLKKKSPSAPPPRK